MKQMAPMFPEQEGLLVRPGMFAGGNAQSWWLELQLTGMRQDSVDSVEVQELSNEI